MIRTMSTLVTRRHKTRYYPEGSWTMKWCLFTKKYDKVGGCVLALGGLYRLYLLCNIEHWGSWTNFFLAVLSVESL